MVKFESEIGSRNYTSTMRQIDVPDGEDFIQQAKLAEMERQLAEARKLKVEGKEKISEGAKRRIEILIGMTKSSREVVINKDAVFVLTSLKSKDVSQAMEAAASVDNISSSFELKRQLLARSITSISGIDINAFLSSNALEDKLNFVDELDDALTTKLYNEYVILSQEIQNKYAINNEDQAKEVGQELKK